MDLTLISGKYLYLTVIFYFKRETRVDKVFSSRREAEERKRELLSADGVKHVAVIRKKLANCVTHAIEVNEYVRDFFSEE